ncbi:hypothetical protein NE237_018155 [Protea cynaroides]|uniref:Uncharacterized protein n=1 Tax=Protea cynaroides TaxID=273540 RepID=A0A9Q0K9I0_9MAGN|nr:hypothetical protein NE237_018155 [Protea cynaroides]
MKSGIFSLRGWDELGWERDYGLLFQLWQFGVGGLDSGLVCRELFTHGAIVVSSPEGLSRPFDRMGSFHKFKSAISPIEEDSETRKQFVFSPSADCQPLAGLANEACCGSPSSSERECPASLLKGTLENHVEDSQEVEVWHLESHDVEDSQDVDDGNLESHVEDSLEVYRLADDNEHDDALSCCPEDATASSHQDVESTKDMDDKFNALQFGNDEPESLKQLAAKHPRLLSSLEERI